MTVSNRIFAVMSQTYLIILTAALILACILHFTSFGQTVSSIPYKSQEVSEKDGIPVLIKHLPDWESVRGQTTFAHNLGELKAALGDRPLLDLIDFSAGTAAVTAPQHAVNVFFMENTMREGAGATRAKLTASI